MIPLQIPIQTSLNSQAKMEKSSSSRKTTSLPALFIVNLCVAMLIMGAAEAREIPNESVYSQVQPKISVGEILKQAVCKIDGDCKQHCRSGCAILNCISGTCFCEC